jgi:hypothetical protein
MVDTVEGDRMKLANIEERGSLDYRPQRFIPLSLVDHVENGMVWLRVKGAEVTSFKLDARTYASNSSGV